MIRYRLPSMLSIATLAAGCKLDWDSCGIQYTHSECEVPLMRCRRALEPVAVTVRAPVGASRCYEVHSDFQVGASPYCDQNWAVQRIDLDALKGARWLASSWADRAVSAPSFVELTLSGDYLRHYVAFDARVSPPPSWLSARYVRAEDAAGQPARVVVTTVSGPLELDIWMSSSNPESDIAARIAPPGPSRRPATRRSTTPSADPAS